MIGLMRDDRGFIVVNKIRNSKAVLKKITHTLLNLMLFIKKAKYLFK